MNDLSFPEEVAVSGIGAVAGVAVGGLLGEGRTTGDRILIHLLTGIAGHAAEVVAVGLINQGRPPAPQANSYVIPWGADLEVGYAQLPSTDPPGSPWFSPWPEPWQPPASPAGLYF